MSRWKVVEVRENGEEDELLFNNSHDINEYLDNTEGYNLELIELDDDNG